MIFADFIRIYNNMKPKMKIFESIRLAAVLPIAGLALSAALVSCAPQAFTMNVEMRHPSKSGIDLAGKSISVVYLDDLSGKDSVFCEYLANGFAAELEKDYFNGKSLINIYKMTKDMSGDYSSKDTLRNLVMDTNTDLIFLFDSPEFGKMAMSERKASGLNKTDSSTVLSAKFPLTVRLYAYDSMNKTDSVQVFKGTTTADQLVFFPNDAKDTDVQAKIWKGMAPIGEDTGKRSACNFLSTWKNEEFTLVYYETPEAWSNGAQAAYEYRWKDAITAWMTVLDANNPEKRACAEYNIATACYMLGNMDLATKWLDQSDKDNKIALSDGLRARINSKRK